MNDLIILSFAIIMLLALLPFFLMNRAFKGAGRRKEQGGGDSGRVGGGDPGEGGGSGG